MSTGAIEKMEIFSKKKAFVSPQMPRSREILLRSIRELKRNFRFFADPRYRSLRILRICGKMTELTAVFGPAAAKHTFL